MVYYRSKAAPNVSPLGHGPGDGHGAHVVTDGPVLPHALALAREYAAIAPLTFTHIKRLIRQEAEKPLEDGLTMERTLFLDFLVSDDANKLMKRMNDGALDIREVPQGE